MDAKRRYFNKFVFIIAICLIGLIAWWFSDRYFASEIASFQVTSDWMKWTERIPPQYHIDHVGTQDPTMPSEIRSSVFIRTDTRSNRLFLRHNYGTVIYMYDSSSHQISEVSEADWLKATGEITRCRLQATADYNRQIKFSTYPDYAVVLNGEKVDTYGRYSLLATESPTHSKVALLSAAGYRTGPGPTIIFGLGGSPPVIHGQKYVQIMDLNSKTFMQEPVRIDGTERSEDYRFCWTEDEKYLVVYKPYENFSIVETNKTVQ